MGGAGNQEAEGSAPDRVGSRAGKELADVCDVAADIGRGAEALGAAPDGLCASRQRCSGVGPGAKGCQAGVLVSPPLPHLG